MTSLCITGDPTADQLLGEDPLALLIGMALDQQIPMEKAFSGPAVLRQRLGYLDAERITQTPPEAFAAAMAGPPAVHRFPGSMAKRIQDLCAVISTDYGNDAATLWSTARTGAELLERVAALPGFATQKAQIFVALLGKQWGVRPRGWRTAAGDYGQAGVRKSVADVTSRQTLLQVRAYKQEQKARARAGTATA